MRISDADMYEYGKLLTERFPSLRLQARSVGWSINRGIVKVSMDLDSGPQAIAWMDGFHKGADEQEAIIRGKIQAMLIDMQYDRDQIIAMLSTWLP